MYLFTSIIKYIYHVCNLRIKIIYYHKIFFFTELNKFNFQNHIFWELLNNKKAYYYYQINSCQLITQKIQDISHHASADVSLLHENNHGNTWNIHLKQVIQIHKILQFKSSNVLVNYKITTVLSTVIECSLITVWSPLLKITFL